MIDIVATAKEHPIAATAIGIGVVAIGFIALRGGGSGGVNAQQAQINSLNAGIIQGGEQIAMQREQDQTQVALANIGLTGLKKQLRANFNIAALQSYLANRQLGIEGQLANRQLDVQQAEYNTGQAYTSANLSKYFNLEYYLGGKQADVASAEINQQGQNSFFSLIGGLFKNAGTNVVSSLI